MKHIAGWFRRNNTLMAQAKDLSRQLQEVWAENRVLKKERHDWKRSAQIYHSDYEYVKDMLHRVARERDEERRLRLEAEKKHRDIVWAWSDKQIAEAAEELRDTYLENDDEAE